METAEEKRRVYAETYAKVYKKAYAEALLCRQFKDISLKTDTPKQTDTINKTNGSNGRTSTSR